MAVLLVIAAMVGPLSNGRKLRILTLRSARTASATR